MEIIRASAFYTNSTQDRGSEEESAVRRLSGRNTRRITGNIFYERRLSYSTAPFLIREIIKLAELINQGQTYNLANEQLFESY